MKYAAFIFILFAVTAASGQANSTKFKSEILKSEYLLKTDVKAQIVSQDISGILTKTNNASIRGFIGKDFQRIKVKLISVIKNAKQPDQYFAYGKSMVKTNVCEFQGTITLATAYFQKETDASVSKQGVIVGDYSFFENPAQKEVGQFKGVFKTGFYIDKQNKIQYDDLMGGADGFTNNEFVGVWTSYGGKITMECNWGDNRIPMSGDLDMGAGEFVPNDKYLKNGWQNYKLAYFGPEDKTAEEARKKENEVWWK